ncbi:MAG: hypothetical protein MNSN_03880 [Minisyncoccus archaeiphilus]|nr:MAG: hypothetical protein MNSN_03880 [Candidatus Parcubacteria bacterium]
MNITNMFNLLRFEEVTTNQLAVFIRKNSWQEID